VRRANTPGALRALARERLLDAAAAGQLAQHYHVLRGVSLALRLFGARPTDTLDIAGPMPARVAKALAYPDREAFLADYRRRTDAVRRTWERMFGG
jgi:glutamine synthetase adenylyltransferase